MRLLSRGPAETLAFGRKLAALLKPGDVVCLYGDLGAGKTTFVKGLAAGLGIPERDVTSASFTIVAEYRGTLRGVPVPFFHIDLYRIERAEDLDSVGLDGYIGRDGIAVVEWAEHLGDMAGAVSVLFEVLNNDERELTISGIDETDWHNL